MASERKRSRRLTGAEPSPLKASNCAVKRYSQLRSLLCTDGRAGRAAPSLEAVSEEDGDELSNDDNEENSESSSNPSEDDDESFVTANALEYNDYELESDCDSNSDYDSDYDSDVVDDNESTSSDDKDSYSAVDYSDISNSMNGIIHLHTLKEYIEQNFVCKHCSELGITSQISVSYQPIGLATTLCHCCSNEDAKHSSSISSATIDESVATEILPKKKGWWKRSTLYYSLNYRAIMAMQCIGRGLSDLNTVVGFLGLRGLNPRNYKKMELFVGRHEREGCDEVIASSLQKEKLLSPKDDNGKEIIVGSYDMGWNKRSSGNRYDSLSGQAAFIGSRSGKVLSYIVMSKKCRLCMAAEKNSYEAEPHDCPFNHTGSSKSMESLAAIELLKDLWYNKQTAVSGLVTDDDCTTRTITKHRIQDKIDAGLMKQEDWPLNDKGKPVDDNGQLPLDVPEIKEYYSDPNHRTKVFGKALYALAVAAKRTVNIYRFTKGKAQKLKRNKGYWMKKENKGTFEEFVQSSAAVIDHQWNMHERCGLWCRFSPKQPADKQKEQTLDDKCKYYDMNDDNDKNLYKQIRELTDRFFTLDMLKQCYHPFHSNFNEALNKIITMVAPKDRTYSMSGSLKSRVAVAIGINSVGYMNFFSDVFERCGILHTACDDSFLSSLDRNRNRANNYKKLPEVKRKRATQQLAKMNEEIEKEKQDRKRKLTYQSGVAVHGDDSNEDRDGSNNTSTENTMAARSKKMRVCGACGQPGHNRKNKKCPNYVAKNSLTVAENSEQSRQPSANTTLLRE